MTSLSRDMSVALARRALADAFRQAGLDSPELDARLLVGHALGLDHTALTVETTRNLGEDGAGALVALAARRLDHEPVARILGVKEFWGLPLRLNAATLVPRPETETVVEAALAALDQDGPRTRALRIADLGTGSGALLIALLSELPNASGIGTDISGEALAAARDNAGRLGLASRAGFAACNFGAALTGSFDLMVSNPPYIASGDIARLPPEVRHDPHRALDGGADGLGCYRTIAGQVPKLLEVGGHLVVELGIGQEPAVAALFRAAGLAPSPARHDLAGIPRALLARVATITP
ncbi:MAG: release factor glutamine methyltransferase [Alphaproteobacteria bacterium]|nr:release factor glutamine methyltransferase [Alphaproteobacteria bacterium]